MIDIECVGNKSGAVVNLRDAGEKGLLLAWAPLQKVGG